MIWQPYTTQILTALPSYCLHGESIWRTRAPLICFEVVEWHLPDRVMRQFGLYQVVPQDCDTSSTLHATDRRGRGGYDWSAIHRDFVTYWDTRRDHIIRADALVDPLSYADVYMTWYRSITRRFISPPPVRAPRFGAEAVGGMMEILGDTMAKINALAERHHGRTEGVDPIVEEIFTLSYSALLAIRQEHRLSTDPLMLRQQPAAPIPRPPARGVVRRRVRPSAGPSTSTATSPASTTIIPPAPTTTSPPTTIIPPAPTTTSPASTTIILPAPTTTSPASTTIIPPAPTTTSPATTTIIPPAPTSTSPATTTIIPPAPTTTSPASTTIIPPAPTATSPATTSIIPPGPTTTSPATLCPSPSIVSPGEYAAIASYFRHSSDVFPPWIIPSSASPRTPADCRISPTFSPLPTEGARQFRRSLGIDITSPTPTEGLTQLGTEGVTCRREVEVVDADVVDVGRGRGRGRGGRGRDRSRGRGRSRVIGAGVGVEVDVEADVELHVVPEGRPQRKKKKPSCGTH